MQQILENPDIMYSRRHGRQSVDETVPRPLGVIHILRHSKLFTNGLQRLASFGEVAGMGLRDSPYLILMAPQECCISIAMHLDFILLHGMIRGFNHDGYIEMMGWEKLRDDGHVPRDDMRGHSQALQGGLAQNFSALSLDDTEVLETGDPWLSVRAEEIRRRLKTLAESYRNIFVVSHFALTRSLGFLDRETEGPGAYRFRFQEEHEAKAEEAMAGRGIGVDRDGPTTLVPLEYY